MKPMLADVGIGILFAPLPALIALLISVTLIESFVKRIGVLLVRLSIQRSDFFGRMPRPR